MELREFAQQVLFATTLEDKLRRPESVTDERPGPAMLAPSEPGRPPELKFKPTGSGNRDFPGLHHLEQERERGRLLHFFANHELLATELMALVLLRFPEAPAAFRRGVLQTLQEEQDHVRMYLRRMEDCGLHFGELPVSGYFWRAVSPMAQPIDFVAGLSLTFEQANLDFCRQFARAFTVVGDTQTAALLDGIYRDEIAHVAHGLKWFRRWKKPDESDWEAFCRQLRFPLSPQRAKGMTLNVEGRRAAGFDPGFIAQLDVFSQSKGRTPHVFVFNPFAEGYLSRGRSFNPVQSQAQLARDLANLPQFLGRQDDVVLVHRRPSAEFLSQLKQQGFPLPEFVEMEGVSSSPLRDLGKRKLGALRPWAWGPDSFESLQPLFASVTGETRPPALCWNEAVAQLYSKAWSAQFLSRFLAEDQTADLFEELLCPTEIVGMVATRMTEALDLIARFRSRGFAKLVVKESVGLAGRNALRLWEPDLLPNQRRWIESAVEQEIPLVIEPWLERQVDFSIQWEMKPDGLRLLGFTGLEVDLRGQYQGNWVEAQPRRIPQAVLSKFPAVVAARLPHLFHRLGAVLEQRLRQLGFQGPLGMDAFVYRDSQGVFRLKPVVEINPRFTMGRVALELMRQVAPGSHARFQLINRAQLKASGFSDFFAWAQSRAQQHPCHLEGEPVARLRQGMVCLNDPRTAEFCLAVLDVRKSGVAVEDRCKALPISGFES